MYNSFDNAPTSRANGGHYRQICIKIFHIFFLLSIFQTSRPLSALLSQLPYKWRYAKEQTLKSLFLCKAQVNETLEQNL